KVKVVAHPIGCGVGVEAVGDAGGAAGGEGQAVIRNAEHGDAVSEIAGAAVVYGDGIDDSVPGGGIEDAVVVGVQIDAKRAGEVADEQQGDRAVFDGVHRQVHQVEAVGVGRAEADHLVDGTGGGAAIAFNLQKGIGRVVGVGRAVELDIFDIVAGCAGGEFVDDDIGGSDTTIGAVGAQAVKGIGGEAVPLQSRIEGVAGVRVAGADAGLAAQGVVGR